VVVDSNNDPERIRSLDQLRGYAIFGMIVVNYLSYFPAIPFIFHHHRNMYSYADTIWPLFMFVVGMGMRMSLARRVEKMGRGPAYWSVAKRYLLIAFVGIVFCGPDYTTDWWNALPVIGLSGVLCIVFIDKGAPVRIAAIAGFMAVYAGIFHLTGYGDWLALNSMNGGPLGPISFAVFPLIGSFAWDLRASGNAKRVIGWSAGLTAGFIAAGLIAYVLLPAHATLLEYYGPYWPFAQRWANPPVMFLSAGMAWAAFGAFYALCDLRNIEIPTLSILGQNALTIYLIQFSLMSMHMAYLPRSSSVPVALLGFVAMYGFLYATARWLDRQGILIKL
jgi:predicted acyltransferase